MTCQHPRCSTPVVPKGKGRPPKFCPGHQGGAAAKRRQRQRDREPQPRPPCCIEAGRLHGRKSCEQHKDQRKEGGINVVFGAQWILNADDYAGAEPRPKRTPPKPEPDVRRTVSLRDDRLLWSRPMTERYKYGPLRGTKIPVIGQPDLTADWTPSRHADAKPQKGLVPRSPAWPFDAPAIERIAA
jgi:hypothetical protein